MWKQGRYGHKASLPAWCALCPPRQGVSYLLGALHLLNHLEWGPVWLAVEPGLASDTVSLARMAPSVGKVTRSALPAASNPTPEPEANEDGCCCLKPAPDEARPLQESCSGPWPAPRLPIGVGCGPQGPIILNTH